jgi:hypothetical protein
LNILVPIQNLIRGITILNHIEKVNFEFLDSDEQMNRYSCLGCALCPLSPKLKKISRLTLITFQKKKPLTALKLRKHRAFRQLTKAVVLMRLLGIVIISPFIIFQPQQYSKTVRYPVYHRIEYILSSSNHILLRMIQLLF